MRKKVKLRLCKNDPFGVKHKIFMLRLERHLKAWININTKAIAVCLNAINVIGIPRDQEEKNVLEKAVTEYDKAISDIEETFLKHARMYLECDVDE